MKIKRYLITALAGLLLLATGCKKLLNINRDDSIDKTTPVSVDDYKKLLDNPDMYDFMSNVSQPDKRTYTMTDVMSDDAYRPKFTIDGDNERSVKISRAYLWSPISIWMDLDLDDLYLDSYKWISQMNILIDNMPGVQPAGQDEERALAIARARVNRAYFYLLLVNTYGAAYNAATADSDLGVPLLVHASVTSQPRASVKEVYQQIITDLQEAINTPQLPNLQNHSLNMLYPTKGEAWALLARSYLYMGQYEAARQAADEALKINNALFDYRQLKPLISTRPGYNFFAAVDSRPLNLKEQWNRNPECYTPRLVSVMNPDRALSKELASKFEPQDMRYVATVMRGLTQSDPNNPIAYYMYSNGENSSAGYGNYWVGVPEMMLTKAECLARNGDAAGAIKLLNDLRKYRFKVEDYREMDPNVDAETALRQVFDERRRELMFRGLRLADLKRLNLDPRFKKELVRYDDNGKEIARLPAGDPRYLVPFSPQVMAGNPLLVQNPR